MLVQQAGLQLLAVQRIFFGIFHVMEVMPTGTESVTHTARTGNSTRAYHGDRHEP